MAVQLPPNSTGSVVATLTSGGKEFQQAILVDATTPTQGLAIDTTGGAMIRGEAASGAAVAGNPVLIGGQDGTNAVSLKTNSAANIAAATAGPGSVQVASVGNWSINNLGAAATAATVSRAAGAAGVRHVCTSVAANLSTVGTAQTAVIAVNLRDGATGAGTVLWSQQISLTTNTFWQFTLGGLSIFGTAATAMTLEFGANNVAASFTSVALTGYDTV